MVYCYENKEVTEQIKLMIQAYEDGCITFYQMLSKIVYLLSTETTIFKG